jgi:choline-glycine betaine transporter
MRYLLIAGGALVVGLFAAGTPLQSLLPFVLILACPLMMVVMMRGMGRHTDQDDTPHSDRKTDDRHDATTGR